MPPSAIPVQDGFIKFPYHGEIYQTYYKIFGDLEKRTRTPVVVLHGGPGLSHDYVLPLADLAEQGYPVIFYDQIGNARSTHLPDKPPTFWTIDLFLDELENLLEHFRIQDGYHIVGHSWGGMMSPEFVVRRHPPGLQRLVISDSPASIALWADSAKELISKFSDEVKEAFKKGFEDRERYWKARLEVYAVHGCRVKPFPQELEYSLLLIYGENADRTVDKAPVLDGWTIVERLRQVDVPTLVINGRYDIAQDFTTKPFADNIPGAKWITFEDSSHTPFWEERARYMKVVGDFLGE
ncbi:proline-specific peptidase [Cubamyces sp. BRFM 1775]|nr:proline-specific peptidase [Cubamyces sp. BRFM 1775]